MRGMRLLAFIMTVNKFPHIAHRSARVRQEKILRRTQSICRYFPSLLLRQNNSHKSKGEQDTVRLDSKGA